MRLHKAVKKARKKQANATYLAIDASGDAYAYESKPLVSKHRDWWSNGGETTYIGKVRLVSSTQYNIIQLKEIII